MKRSQASRIGMGILILLLVIILVAAVLVVSAIRRPFPTTSGTVTVAGLDSEVNILRDDLGIPHIYADSEKDLFFAQGYVHAQDRFWQMEFWRHVGEGRLSEMIGSATVDSDRFIRTMGWHRMAQTTVDYFIQEQPAYYAILEAYSAGVNAYIEENRDDLSFSHTVLGLVNDPWEIEPWEPIHTVAWGVVMSNDLGGNWSDELWRLDMIKALGEEKVDELFPFYPYNDRPVVAPTSALDAHGPPGTGNTSPAAQVDWDRVNTDLVALPPEDGFAFGGGPWVGSNNWVVSGEHTENGMPLLANDPHLGIQMPSIWYEIGLHARGFNVVGFSFAGVPGVVIGHNDNIAWGVTNVGPDVQDLYIERVNPDNPMQYEYMGEWQDMEVIDEVIRVNGGEDINLQVRLTRHGPIINEVVDGQSDVLSMRWTAQEPSRVLESVLLLNQAANYQDFREAMRYWDVPSQNVVYADVEGNIAYQVPGLIPIRRNGNGLLPVPGWTDEYEWTGWVPFEELPALFNPESGYIVTANHAVVDEDYPYLLSLYWADGDRGQRITDLIEEVIGSRKINADDFARIQSDSYSMMAERYAPLFDGLSSDDPQVQAAIEHIQGWDFQERRDSVAAALWEIFFMQLVERAMADDMEDGDASDAYNSVHFHDLAEQPDSFWWDDQTTGEVETLNDMALLALQDAIAWFEENLDGEMEEWTWGSIHTATFVSTPLGESGIGPIESIVNRGPFPADGGRNIVNANGWSWSNPASITGHPSMRMIVDMGDFDASRSVIPTGQSGNPYNSHYGDMIELWLNGETHPMWFSQAAVEAAAEDTMTLQPPE